MAHTGETQPQWHGTTYGNSWWVERLIAMMRVVDVRVFYWIVFIFAIPPTLLLAGRSRRLTYRRLRHRHGMSQLRAALMTWGTFNRFATVILDRFAMYAGRRFDVTVDGMQHYESRAAGAAGFILLSSHIGNYELAGYTLRADSKRFNALVYGGEKDFVMNNRRRLFGSNNINMIAVGESMSHLFEIDTALNAGEIVSMPADRMFGSRRAFTLPFMGADAQFPAGPFMTAALKGVDMLFVAVMKLGGLRYRVIVKPIETPATERADTRQRAAMMARRYRDILEETVSEYPDQWYNFYEFWNTDNDRTTSARP